MASHVCLRCEEVCRGCCCVVRQKEEAPSRVGGGRMRAGQAVRGGAEGGREEGTRGETCQVVWSGGGGRGSSSLG